MKPYYQDEYVTLYNADCREILSWLSGISMIMTSPPCYGKYDYDMEGQDGLGLDESPAEYAAGIGQIFTMALATTDEYAEAWLVIGDTYNNWSPVRKNQAERKQKIFKAEKRRRNIAGYYEKELLGVPFLVKDEIRRSGWAWRSLNIWSKTTSAYDKPTDRPGIAHEYILQFVKPGRKRRLKGRFSGQMKSVRTIMPQGHPGFPAAYPESLISPIIESVTSIGDIVLDMFAGSGTTLAVAKHLGRRAIGIEINPDYCAIASNRCRQMSFNLEAK